MKTKIEELNEKLKNLIVGEMDDELKHILKEQPNNFISTNRYTHKNCSRIYGYLYQFDELGYEDLLMELEVAGIGLSNDEIYVVLCEKGIHYETDENVYKDFENGEPSSVYSLFNSELLGWFTMINIMESIEEYI